MTELIDTTEMYLKTVYEPLIGELQGAILGDLDETVTLHARHRLGDRGARVVETLDDAGTQRGNTVLLKLIRARGGGPASPGPRRIAPWSSPMRGAGAPPT